MPDLDDGGVGIHLLWGVGAVSRRLGITTPTLRTWDRRYGLSPSRRTAGGHRRYSEQDVARVARASQLIVAGVPSAQAAQMAIGSLPDPQAAEPAPSPDPSLEPVPPVPGAPPVTVEVLLHAAQALDAPGLATLLAVVFDRRGVLAGWTEVVAPFLVCVGEEWLTGGCGVEAEHLASESVSTELRYRLRDLRARHVTSPAHPPVLLAGACGDRHGLPLVALAAALSDRRVRTWLLGSSLPSEALLSAIERVSPRAVFVWSSLEAGGQLADLGTVREAARDPVLVLGGPGWTPPLADSLPGRERGDSRREPVASEWVPDLGTAVDRITALVA